VDPRMSSPIFATREEFLNMCQGNRLQFDELRRAKYSSMMVLFHLHNPRCVAASRGAGGGGLTVGRPASRRLCTRAIPARCVVAAAAALTRLQNEISGDRYSCSTCSSFDLCDTCYTRVSHAHPLTLHKLGAHKPGSQGDPHMLLLDHSSACALPSCAFPNCSRMKALLAHSPECSVRIQGGCVSCTRFWRLLSHHAKQCHRAPKTCSVPHCDKLKLHLRQKQNDTADRRMRAVMDQQKQSDAEPTSASTPQPGTTPAPTPPAAGHRASGKGKGT
jgi:E1A/CREB-binding protein